MISREPHDRMANAIRFLSMDAIEKANSGHPGLPMGAADVATVLFSRYLKVDPKTPLWPDDAKARADANNPDVQRWEARMKQFQQPVPAAGPDGTWLEMERVFRLTDHADR